MTKSVDKIKRNKKPADPQALPVERTEERTQPLATEIRKQRLLEALEQTLGVVTTACRKIGMERSTVYNWLKNDPDFKARYDELQSVALDFAESKLHQRIAEGSDACTIFYLKTKGKGRGYVERTEISGGGNPIAIRVVTTDVDITGAIDQL
jgi:hypothetical protein